MGTLINHRAYRRRYLRRPPSTHSRTLKALKHLLTHRNAPCSYSPDRSPERTASPPFCHAW
eukprot:4733064-Pleurochrysis_carterae.AAC.1